MKEIGTAYFQWGWLVTCAVTAWLGWLSAERRQPKIMWAACIGALVLGGLMFWAKHA